MFIDPNGLAINDGTYVQNGQGYGEVGGTFNGVRWDDGMMRPFLDDKGRRCVLLNTRERLPDGRPRKKKYLISKLQERGLNSPVFNAMTLPKDSWIELDRAIVRATRQRLRAWTDLEAANPRGGFDAMARLTLEYQAMTDPGEAVVDMDAISDGRTDRPLFNLTAIPLPITHSDFFFTQREIAVSRNSGTPLDTTMAESCGRRIAEAIEKTTIGVQVGAVFGPKASGDARYSTYSGAVYGYTNYPYRVTKTDLTVPTGANPEAIKTDVQEMMETMRTNGFFGPYMLYHSTPYSIYLEDDYFRAGSTSAVRIVRERLMALGDIQDIRRLDYLTSGFQLILVQMTSEVAQAVNGMEISTVQWETRGGLQQNFKIMAIKVPLLKRPYNDIAGIVHGTTA